MNADQVRNVNPAAGELLDCLVEWARLRFEVLAVALVGSYARGEATDSSDVDLLILVRAPQEVLKDTGWPRVFGDVSTTAVEDWGKVTSLRVFYSNGLEVEFGLTDGRWGSDPGDRGDAQVIRDGIFVLFERSGHLTEKIRRFEADPGAPHNRS